MNTQMVPERSERPRPLPPDECYRAALEQHSSEFRALGERASIFTVVQSILIGASVLILVYQGVFGYMFPYMLSGMVAVGALFCLLHFAAGRTGADNAFAWRQYMRSIEHGHPELPLTWFYDSHEKRYGDKMALEELPLPSNWLYPPTIFLLMWLIAALYIPSRVMFDSTFATSSCRPAVLFVSMTIVVCVFALFCLLAYRAITTLKVFRSLIRRVMASKKDG